MTFVFAAENRRRQWYILERHTKLKIAIPENARTILQVLHNAGYEAYIVGGCVRDALLGRQPGDWDLTTSAKPQQVKALFRRTVDTGIQHGTVTVMMDKEGYEVTTYRLDGVYEDHRHPKEVAFTNDLKEDMKRRDFTINAMAYNEEEGLVDYFGGRNDLKQGVIRCVGNPMERFEEDALRVLRALRFAGQLGFSVEEKTKEAMRQHSGYLKEVSAERIRVELEKLLLSDQPQLLLSLGRECHITDIVLPEVNSMLDTKQLNPHHCYDVGHHCMKAVLQVDKKPHMRWAALLHDVGKPCTATTDEKGVMHFYGHPAKGAELAKKILRRLKYDNDTIKKVEHLIYWHDYDFGTEITLRRVRRAMYKIGPDAMPDLFSLKQADILSQSEEKREEKLQLLEQVKQAYSEVKKQGQCVTMKELAVNGKDLIALGIKPGKRMGEILKALLEYVVEHPECNTKEQLITTIQTQYEEEVQAKQSQEE